MDRKSMPPVEAPAVRAIDAPKPLIRPPKIAIRMGSEKMMQVGMKDASIETSVVWMTEKIVKSLPICL